VVSYGPTQVAVEYCMVARSLFIVSWYCVFMVEVVVGAAAVSTFGYLVPGHAYISGIAKLKAVLAD